MLKWLALYKVSKFCCTCQCLKRAFIEFLEILEDDKLIFNDIFLGVLCKYSLCIIMFRVGGIFPGKCTHNFYTYHFCLNALLEDLYDTHGVNIFMMDMKIAGKSIVHTGSMKLGELTMS